MHIFLQVLFYLRVTYALVRNNVKMTFLPSSTFSGTCCVTDFPLTAVVTSKGRPSNLTVWRIQRYNQFSISLTYVSSGEHSQWTTIPVRFHSLAGNYLIILWTTNPRFSTIFYFQIRWLRPKPQCLLETSKPTKKKNFCRDPLMVYEKSSFELNGYQFFVTFPCSRLTQGELYQLMITSDQTKRMRWDVKEPNTFATKTHPANYWGIIALP